MASVFAHAYIHIDCGFTCLNAETIISGDFGGISQMLEASSPTAIEQFQRIFPDQHNFRVELIEETIRFEKSQQAQVVVFTKASSTYPTHGLIRIHYYPLRQDS